MFCLKRFDGRVWLPSRMLAIAHGEDGLCTAAGKVDQLTEEGSHMAEMNRDRIWNALTDAVTNVLAEQGRTPGPMTPESLINQDLGVTSIDFVHVLLALEDELVQAFEFEKVALRNGIYRTDLTLGELFEFMVKTDEATGLSTAAVAS